MPIVMVKHRPPITTGGDNRQARQSKCERLGISAVFVQSKKAEIALRETRTDKTSH